MGDLVILEFFCQVIQNFYSWVESPEQLLYFIFNQPYIAAPKSDFFSKNKFKAQNVKISLWNMAQVKYLSKTSQTTSNSLPYPPFPRKKSSWSLEIFEKSRSSTIREPSYQSCDLWQS